MSIWSKVLIGLILVASLPLFVLAAIVLKANESWHGKVVTKLEAHIADLETKLDKIKRGDDPAAIESGGGQYSLADLETQFYILTHDRKRVWYGCLPARNADTLKSGSATLTIPAPDPSGVVVGMVIHAFEEMAYAEGGKYLGEFRVSAVNPAEKKADIVPTRTITADEIKRISESKAGGWTLCELMPTDRHQFFDRAQIETLLAGLPAATIDEFKNDGQPDGQGGVNRRRLRDYAFLMNYVHRRISDSKDMLAALATEGAQLQATVNAAKASTQSWLEVISQNLQPELTRLRAERDLVQNQLNATEMLWASTRQEIEKTLSENHRLAGEISDRQLQLAAQLEVAISRDLEGGGDLAGRKSIRRD